MEELLKLLDEELVFIDQEFSSKEEMIKYFSLELNKKGYVKDTYADAVLRRENVFPTGLDTGEIKICIPHTDCEHVKKPGILVCTLKNGLESFRMDDPSSSIKFELAFILAIQNPEEQVKTLSKLMSLFCKSDVLKAIKESKSKKEVINTIINNIDNKN